MFGPTICQFLALCQCLPPTSLQVHRMLMLAAATPRRPQQQSMSETGAAAAITTHVMEGACHAAFLWDGAIQEQVLGAIAALDAA